ncbi:MAG: hypothetical protein MUF10_08310 [Thermoanaerobaculaceae bacterium]|jgi:hypothetical protein|nr:hypothetical protein [Thermoanaerobaculaceae bacterium]
MVGSTLLAALVVVLGPSDLSFVDTVSGASRTVPLPGVAAAIFVAPDGQVVVPAATEDATWLVAEGRPVERWRGRLVPLFFDEPDRAWVLLPGELTLVSYPERLPLRSYPVPGLQGVRQASTSGDGRLLGVLPTGQPAPVLWMLVPDEAQPVRAVPLPAEGRVVAVAPDTSLVAVGLAGGGVMLVAPEAPSLPALVETPGEVHALGFRPEGKTLLAGCQVGTAGVLLGLRAELRPGKPVKEQFRTPLPAPPIALVVTDAEVLALCGERVEVLGKGGRKLLRTLEAPQARGMALAPTEVKTTLPAWSDR